MKNMINLVLFENINKLCNLKIVFFSVYVHISHSWILISIPLIYICLFIFLIFCVYYLLFRMFSLYTFFLFVFIMLIFLIPDFFEIVTVFYIHTFLVFVIASLLVCCYIIPCVVFSSPVAPGFCSCFLVLCYVWF